MKKPTKKVSKLKTKKKISRKRNPDKKVEYLGTKIPVYESLDSGLLYVKLSDYLKHVELPLAIKSKLKDKIKSYYFRTDTAGYKRYTINVIELGELFIVPEYRESFYWPMNKLTGTTKRETVDYIDILN